MITFAPSPRLRRRGVIASAAVALLLGGSVTPATAGNLCVAMGDSGGQVAGLQMDFKWDSACMSPDTPPHCTAESSTGKDIRAGLKPGPTLKAIFFSMADTSPIPDGNLFCCNFTRSGSGGNACCGLSLGNVLGSDAGGTAIQASAFTLIATMDGQQCAVSEASSGGGSGQQRPPVRGGVQGGSGAVAPPVVSAPGVAAPAQQAPAGGVQPGVPAGRPQAPAAPAGMDQVQRALEQLAPREAPTAVADPTPQAVATPQRTTAAGTPTAKARATEAHGTPTAAAKKTPSAATTPGAKTPGPTPEATPKAEHKGGY
jgi:hypothetical protein